MATPRDKVDAENVPTLESELDSQYTGRNVPVSPQTVERVQQISEAIGMSPKLVLSAMLDIGASADNAQIVEVLTIVMTNRALRLDK